MKHSTVPMRAFSEHGVIKAASVLKSEIAAQISVRITRIFVAMRKALASIAMDDGFLIQCIPNFEQIYTKDSNGSEDGKKRAARRG